MKLEELGERMIFGGTVIFYLIFNISVIGMSLNSLKRIIVGQTENITPIGHLIFASVNFGVLLIMNGYVATKISADTDETTGDAT